MLKHRIPNLNQLSNTIKHQMHMRKCLQIQFIPSNTIKTSQPLNQIYSLRKHQLFYHIKIQRIRIVPDEMYQTG